MATNYRNKLGNYITFEEWQEELNCPDNCSKTETIEKGDYEIVVSKLFIGTTGSLFKVKVNCSEDLEDFFGYSNSFQGEIKAEEDYNRVIGLINDDQPIIQEGVII